MKKYAYLLLVFALIFTLVGCKKENDKKDTDANITIQAPEYLGVGKSVEVKAVDEKGNEVNVEWSIDDYTVATISSNNLTGNTNGILTLTATFKGKTYDAYIVVDTMKTINYELNGGNGDNLETEFFASVGMTLKEPTKEGYKFLGWYSNPSFSGDAVTQVTGKSVFSKLYAKWHSEEFEITYVITTDSGQTETKDGSLFTEDYILKAPTYDASSQVFSGWYTDKKLFNKIDKIEKGYSSDITLYGVVSSKSSKIEVTLAATGATIPGGQKQEISIGSGNLPTPTKDLYSFKGWFKDNKYTIPVEDLYVSSTVYAKFEETYPVTNVNITNTETEIQRKETLQLNYTLNPSKVSVDKVSYESSDTSIATISNTGLITAIKKGMVTFTIKSLSESGAVATINMEIYDAEYFNVSYDTNSFMNVGEKIKLNATYNTRGSEEVNLKWKSLDESIAVVNNGEVTGVKSGFTKIRVYQENNESKYFDFGVTVMDNSMSDVSKYVILNNESNVFVKYKLGIGAGAPVYYKDIIGSVNKLLFNREYEVNRKYEAVQAGISSNHGEEMESIEFITVHYTGNMAKGATGDANASYFANGGGGTSIHYVTGNDGVFHCLADNLVGFHAGDGHGTETKAEWYDTGIKYNESDSIYPVWGISSNSKFTLNGQETLIDVPEGTTADTRKVTDSKWLNNMGLAYTIIDGNYYLGKTWWCYSQISAGRICNKGGNMNSIGIESAVNEGSDLWYTWQITAQLVAHLMKDNNLPIQRVVGHHFYSAKNCPQPMLENNLEIWWKFIDLVKAEYQRITTFNGYKFSMTVLDGDSDNHGRMTDSNEYKSVTYKVTITAPNGTKEEVTLSSIVKGQYSI